ncbi:MAG: sugar phosphate isomerase/epimerase family protein [Acidimicrobiales bacterium]
MTVELELCCMTVRQATLPQLIDVASEHGFAAVTTTPMLYARAGIADRELRRLLDARGVRVTYIDGLITALPGTPPPSGAEASEEDCYRMAAALGAAAINVVHINGSPTPIDDLAAALGPLCERAAARGLRIVMEFLPETGIPDLPTALELVRAVGAGNLGVVLDSWHLARSGGRPEMVDAEATALIGAVQLSDRTRAQDLQPYVPMSGRLLPGDGELPLVDLVSRLPDIPLGIEVISAEMRALTAGEAAAAAAASLRRLLDAVSA